MHRFLAPTAAIACLALIGVAGAQGQATRVATSRGPFVLAGGVSTGGASAFDGDRSSYHGKHEWRFGCLRGRQLAFAVTVTNTSGRTVTLLDAHSADPAPRVIDPVATQVRHAPPPSTGDMFVIVLRNWSATPAGNVTVRPGRRAVVQSNFRVRACTALAHGRTVRVPGSLTLRYRASGRVASEKVTQAGAVFTLVRGPTRRSCSPVAGAIWLKASDISCAVARAVAPACRRMNHHNYGTDCSAAGARWGCGLRAVRVQQCWRGRGENAHWYEVRWALTKR